MRNWPYAFSLGQSDESAVKGLFDVAPLPAGDSGAGSAALGGWQLAVSKYSENPEVAADVALFLASSDEQKIRSKAFNRYPRFYEDGGVRSLPLQLLDVHQRGTTFNHRPVITGLALFFQSVQHPDQRWSLLPAELELDLEDLLGFETGAP
jgi:trehalose/maltose transport system substrate-binding protein